MAKRFLAFAVPAVALTAVLLAAGGAVGGGQEELAGNNLSFPVIFGEGSVPLRGSPGYTSFTGETAYSDPEEIEVWVQQDADNVWQADWSTWGESTPLYVTYVDWGDNLESQDWRLTSKVRVETVLFKDLDTLMNGYKMYYVSGRGTSEVWGTDQTVYGSEQATVYSDHARLTIQKIADIGQAASPDLVWLADHWGGTNAEDPVFNEGCWSIIDGPGGYSAEVNVKGRVIYGFNWDVRNYNDGEGVYRITFSLDSINAPGQLATSLLGAEILLPSEGEETVEALAAASASRGAGGGSTGGGGTAHVDGAYNLTYIDVTIKAGGGGRR